MRKLIIWLLLTTLLMGALPASAAAPIDDLTALAGYFPADSLAFFAIRTDESYIETLDGVFEKISAALPAAGIPPVPVSSKLDQMAVSLGGGNFESVFRPWLGDTIAAGTVWRGESSPRGAIAFSVSDHDVAETFIDEQIIAKTGEEYYQKSEGAGYILWESPEQELTEYVLYEDAWLVLPLGLGDPPVEGFENTLADSVDFNAMMRMLPDQDDGYNIAGYFNPAPLMPVVEAQAGRRFPPLLVELTKARGSYAVGLNILDDRVLVMDVVSSWGNTTALEEAGFTLAMDIGAADLEFAAHIPADAPLVAQTINPGRQAQIMVENIHAVDAWMEAEGISLFADEVLNPQDKRIASGFELTDLLAMANLTLKGLTGLEYEKDIFPVLDGNAAMYLRFDANMAAMEELAASQAYYLPLDMAAVIEVTDADAAGKITEALAGALEENNFEIEREEINGANTVVMPRFGAMINLLLPPEIVAKMPELDHIFGWNEDVFVYGTRDTATYSLAPENDNLASDPTFVAAQAYMLPGAQDILYMNPDGLATLPDIIEMIAEQETPHELDDIQQKLSIVRNILDLIESGTITAISNDNGDTIVRAVLTLAE